MTAFLYLVMIRDYMYEHLADLTGARVTYTYGRIGGLARDLPDGWLDAPRGDPRPVRGRSSAACTGWWTATASSSTACATSA